jgi:hypothetical protein
MSGNHDRPPTMGGHEVNTGGRGGDDYDDTSRRVQHAFNPSPMIHTAPVVQPKLPSTRLAPTPLYQPQQQQQQQQREPAPAFRWRLSDIPTLAEYHRVERTAVLVDYAAENPSLVTGRISDVLRDRSIEAEYDNDKAKVKCMTPDGVDFRIRLYRGRGQYSHGIIVEVQRRFGTSINFLAETRAILDAAQGHIPSPPPLLSNVSAGNTAPLPMVTETEDDYIEPPPTGAASLEMVNKMLQHQTPDTHYLALQTLLSLTDMNKMGLGTARGVSAELLRPDNETGARLFAFMSNKSSAEASSSSSSSSQQEFQDVFHLRVMALTVLANAVQATRGHMDAGVLEQIRPVLIQELKTADSNPRSAQIAARCFEYLRLVSSADMELRSALETARKAGEVRHVGLMHQAQLCLDAMS